MYFLANKAGMFDVGSCRVQAPVSQEQIILLMIPVYPEARLPQAAGLAWSLWGLAETMHARARDGSSARGRASVRVSRAGMIRRVAAWSGKKERNSSPRDTGIMLCRPCGGGGGGGWNPPVIPDTCPDFRWPQAAGHCVDWRMPAHTPGNPRHWLPRGSRRDAPDGGMPRFQG